MLRAEIQRARRRALGQLRRLARLANSPGFKSFHCPRWRIKFSLGRFSDPSRICLRLQGVGKFSRARSAGGRRYLQLNFVNQIVSVAEDCLSPERTFHGCQQNAYPWLFQSRFSLRAQGVGKFSRASSAGGRRHLQLNFVNQIVSVAEDCLSPERTFHGCPLMHFRDSIPWLDSVTCAMRAISSATLQAKHHRSGRTTAA